MEQTIAVEMISFCSADGSVRPLRFRYEDPEQCWQTVQIAQIVSVKEVQYVGLEAFCYDCRAVVGDRMRDFTLRYGVRNHQWTLMKVM